MPRKRVIDPAFFTDTTLGSLSRDVRLLYIGMWCVADDAGLYEHDAELLRVSVFPFDRDIDAAAIVNMLSALSAGKTPRLRTYDVAGKRYGVVVNFMRHQRVDHPTPSKHPRPPEKVLMQLDAERRKKIVSLTEAPRVSRRLASARETSREPSSVSRALARNVTNVTNSNERNARERAGTLRKSSGLRPIGAVLEEARQRAAVER